MPGSKLILGVLAAVIAAPTMAAAQPRDSAFQGKTIRIVVALGVGGDYDDYARLIGRWLGKYIPGNPTVVVQNMPGAGGLAAANYLYNVAPKDGTVLGALHSNTTVAQVTSAPNVEYDARQLGWVGRISSGGLKVHYALYKNGAYSSEDLIAKALVVGGGGATSESVVVPTVINQLMGGRLKILQGYKGTAEMTLALERGEIDVAYQAWDILSRNNAEWVKDNKVKVLVQYDMKRDPRLPDVPAIVELTRSDEQRQVWGLFLASGEIGHSLALPPKVPDDRIELMRKAFLDMSADPGLVADAKKISLDVEPMAGDVLQREIQSIFNLPTEAVERYKRVLGR